MGGILEKFEKSSKKRKLDEMQHFYAVKKGFKESMLNINQTLNDFENWDELLNLEEESEEDKKITRAKTVKNEYTKFSIKFIFDWIGAAFCLVHLIGVQASIIILNALFSEIVDEFKLWANNTPRVYNFYEKIQIKSYRELPEIDVAMITSSIGIVILKNYGFYCSNITFQLTSSILFFLLFLLFDFHTNEELSKNYSRLELIVLILSYIFLSFSVGCFSTIALKEYYTICINVLLKVNFPTNIMEKILFYILSGLSAILIIFINRKIFTSFKDITSKWVLMSVVIVCFSSFILSIIFHCIFLIPFKDKDKQKKSKNIHENSIKKEDEKIDEIEQEVINIAKPYENKNIRPVETNEINLEEKSKEKNGPEIFGIKPFEIFALKSKAESEEEVSVKFNQSFPITNENRIYKNEINEITLEKNNKRKKRIKSTKICTLCGYIYIQKEIGNKLMCVFYYYTSKCTWFKEKLIKFDVIAPLITELYCQISFIGYNSILSDKLLNEYSYSKIMKFYIALFILSLFLSSMAMSPMMIGKGPKKINKNEQKIEKELKLEYVECKCCCNNSFLSYIWCFSFGFTFFTFISSLCYITEDNLSKERWNNIIMAGFIFFKIIDFVVLSFYDIFDNTDIFNTSLAITVEKLIWMIIEAIIDSLEPNKKALVIIQIISSSIMIIILFMICCFSCFNAVKKKQNK